MSLKFDMFDLMNEFNFQILNFFDPPTYWRIEK